MPDRRIPSSIIFLAALIMLTIGAAVVAAVVTYLETSHTTRVQANAITRGDWGAGRDTIARYGCGACHIIVGIDGANGKVGPDLTHIGQRATLAGSLPNDPETMVRWLMHPQQLRPGSGMPEMGLTEQEARDAAAFLYAKQ